MYALQNLIKARLYYSLRRCLSQRRRDAIKKVLAGSRKRWGKSLLLYSGRYTAKELVEELNTKIKGDFDILMVHSAYDRLLPMYSGNPQELVNELIAFCGNRRTLVMPTFILGGRLYDAKEYYRTHVFDVRRTVSEMGLLSEIFRR